MDDKIIVTNKEAIIPTHKADHDLYEYRKYKVTSSEDSGQCYVAFYEIPPHKYNYPYHYHISNTEVFYIISGIGVLETPEGNRNITTGDVIVCPPTKQSAHRIQNVSDTQPLVYIDVDTTRFPDIVHYPHSGKTGIIMSSEPSVFFQDNSNVDYYDGE
ncbi:cupin domain-containing protein [Paludicola sp. MB14-C6]|uniref:cupin domain-containing protein n=1 Tax=Paludihabitans sp. MB14-C6 TaxID=3070656 RepID=UPI0027DDE222|nr:cupin domain-containing protein [Paludicola sp. MB14-C6]WMJ23975.1 cupin domain-containing protein [Paludicola sp. MB14-C6]